MRRVRSAPLPVMVAIVTAVSLAVLVAPAGADSVHQLVSVTSAEQGSDGDTFHGQISGTGRYVLFESNGPNLSTRDREGWYVDVFLRDRSTGITGLVSLGSGGRPAHAAWTPSISPSGRFVAFCSTDPRLAQPDSYNPYDFSTLHPDTDVFVRDRTTGTTRRASTTSLGREANNWSCEPSVADTGDVAFRSAASNLVRGDSNGVMDVFLYDWSSRSIRRVSSTANGGEPPRISGDGRYIAFYTGGAQLPSDTNHAMDGYLFKRATLSFERFTRTAAGQQLRIGCDPVGLDISYTGRYVLASCRDGAMASPAVPDKSSHLWRIDRSLRTSRLVNQTPSDYSAVWGASISDDGSRVLFSARAGSYGGNPPDVWDNLYLWRLGSTVRALTPGETDWWWNFTTELSGNGRFALFSSNSPWISSQDLNDPYQTDLFLMDVG
jgi:Tol biopolymer transport system component